MSNCLPRRRALPGLGQKRSYQQEDVSEAWARAGLNVADVWKRTTSVTNEWVYDDQPQKPLKSVFFLPNLPRRSAGEFSCAR